MLTGAVFFFNSNENATCVRNFLVSRCWYHFTCIHVFQWRYYKEVGVCIFNNVFIIESSMHVQGRIRIYFLGLKSHSSGSFLYHEERRLSSCTGKVVNVSSFTHAARSRRLVKMENGIRNEVWVVGNGSSHIGVRHSCHSCICHMHFVKQLEGKKR